MMLSDLGAEVIKIESPDGGDPFRGWALRITARRSLGQPQQEERGARSQIADGAEAARALAADADVLIENFRSARWTGWGWVTTRCSAGNRGLIYASITGFGPSGPLCERAGYDTVAKR
jgi:crotonobetainyl-CoA:carnitine CoA-transferase CaiB-like acyl-CoA transferase